MNKNVEIKSPIIQEYIKSHRDTSEAVFINMAEEYVKALSDGILLYVRKKMRTNSSVFNVGYVDKKGFHHFSLLFTMLGYKTNELEIILKYTGGVLVNDTNYYVCEKLFEEGILNEEEFKRLRSINVAAV